MSNTIPTGVPQAGNPPRMDGVPPERQPTPPVANPAPAATIPVVPPVTPVNVPTNAAADLLPTPEQKPKTAPPNTGDVSNLTGNKALDIAVETFAVATGITSADFERAIGTAVSQGKVELVDKAFLQEKLGDKAQHAIALCEAMVQEGLNQMQNLRQEAYSVAGGEAQWQRAAELFRAKADPALVQAVAAMMDNGNVKQGATVVMTTVQGLGLLTNSNPLVTGDAPTGTPSTALNSADFKAAMTELKKQNGNRSLDNNKQYQDLVERRRQGMLAGLN